MSKSGGKVFVATTLTGTGLTLLVTNHLVTALVVGVLLSCLAEVLFAQYRRARRTETLANRRDCLVVVQNWPDSNGEDLNLDDDEEGTFEGCYEVVDDPADIEWIAVARMKELRLAGNLCCQQDTPEKLRLPVETIYARAGAGRMQKRAEYVEMCRDRISKLNNQFHEELAIQGDGTNYREDVLSGNRLD